MKLKIIDKYLVLPINPNAQMKNISFMMEDSLLLFEYDVHLDTINPKHFSYLNVERYIGTTVDVLVDPPAQFDCVFDNELPENPYKENNRPMLHFSAQHGWINDPNGLFYANGVYHVFFQHNPAEPVWGNMHWGHAVSRDLLHWEELENALFPDDMGMMFSGSAYVDTENASGLKCNENDPILLFYTAAGGINRLSQGRRFTQCIAYSTDNGTTFQKYENNPIIDHICEDNRDPNVTFSSELNRYILALYLRKHEYLLMTSCDLLHWEEFQHIFQREDAECPMIYPIIPENKSEKVWIFSGASDSYTVGIMSIKGFEPIQRSRKYYYGELCSYAAQCFAYPHTRKQIKPYHRRIRMTWNIVRMTDEDFINQLGFPCEVSLVQIDGIYRLRTLPIKEIQTLYRSSEKHDITLSENESLYIQLVRSAYDISIYAKRMVNNFSVSIFGHQLDIYPLRNVIQFNDNIVPLTYTNSPLNLRLLIDTMGIEIFADDGMIYSVYSYPADFGMSYLKIKADKAISDLSINIHQLHSIWEHTDSVNSIERTDPHV